LPYFRGHKCWNNLTWNDSDLATIASFKIERKLLFVPSTASFQVTCSTFGRSKSRDRLIFRSHMSWKDCSWNDSEHGTFEPTNIGQKLLFVPSTASFQVTCSKFGRSKSGNNLIFWCGKCWNDWTWNNPELGTIAITIAPFKIERNLLFVPSTVF
jgi:hypothetical protein